MQSNGMTTTTVFSATQNSSFFDQHRESDLQLCKVFFSRFCGVVATTIKEAQGNEDAKKRTTTRSLQL